MGVKSYFETLGLGENATAEQVVKRYRQLALKHHPNRKDVDETTLERFKELSEAYNALVHGDFSKTQNPLTTFKQCFGYSNPFKPLFDFDTTYSQDFNYIPTTCPPDFDDAIFHREPPHPPSPQKINLKGESIDYRLDVTLEQIATGCEKIFKIIRDVLRFDVATPETKYIRVTVQPGWETGTKIVYEREGHQRESDAKPGDVVFHLNVLPHSVFTRDGHNIRYVCSIPLKLAVGGAVIDIPTLTGRSVQLSLNKNIVNTKTVQNIKGEGLPLSADPRIKGDILVNFNIIFPGEVSPRLKKEILEILPK